MKTRRIGTIAVGAVLIAMLVFAGVALAQLGASKFEITDGNLAYDGEPGLLLDWENVPYLFKGDLASGSTDDSFTGGAKEDTAVPAVDYGSIPPNKSDLKTFGVYVEEATDDLGVAHKYVHMFWTRVQDPSGTTNMDFEFNQSGEPSDNGVTPVRSPGDLLIVYELSNGGTQPTMAVLTWLDGSEGKECEASNKFPCWGDRRNLSDSGDAQGSINEVAIPAEDYGGPLDARTFGEASVSMDAIFDPTQCRSFGSVYLKSRSSDSFTAALKDFIAPQEVSISNCATVTIRKVTDPSGDSATTFGFTSDLVTQPSDPSALAFDLKHGESKTISNVLSGEGYTVTEADPSSAGYDLTDIDCSASHPEAIYDVDVSGGTATFDVEVGKNIDCTFTNSRIPLMKVNKVLDPSGDAGRFNLLIDATTYATNVGNGGTTDWQYVTVGSHTAGEAAGTGTELIDYDTTYECSKNGAPAVAGATVSLAYGDTAECTITNSRKPEMKVNKVLDPSDDPGLFNLKIDTTTHATDVGDGGTTDWQYVTVGSHTAGEAAGTGTELIDYDTTYECSKNGAPAVSGATVSLAYGDTAECTITNSRKPEMKVNKVLDPSDDPGLFNLKIDTTTHATDVGDGGTTDWQYVTVGSHTAGEAAGTGTELIDYDTTYECSKNGAPAVSGATVSLAYGDTAECTITNSRRPVMKVNKVLVGEGDPGLFDLKIDTTTYATDVGDGGTTDWQYVTVGSHTAGEAAGTGIDLTDYDTTYECSKNGAPAVSGATVSLAYGDTAECTITNKPLYTIIVLVCRQSDDTLYPSAVTLGTGDPIASLGVDEWPTTGLPAEWVDDSEAMMHYLCSLGGARFEDLTADDVTAYGLDVKIGSTIFID